MKKTILAIIFLLALHAGVFGQTTILGDANGSGQVDIIDALVVAQYYVGIQSAAIDLTRANVNGDGAVTIVDALLIAQYYVGLITSFPGQTQPTQQVEIIKSAAPRNTNPALGTGELAQLVTDNTTFALDFYRAISGGDGNIIFSPHSISTALAMTYAGAKNATDSEMQSAMRFTLGQARLHTAMNALDLELLEQASIPTGSTGQQLTLKMANSIWGQKNFQFVPDFLDTLAVNYGAGLNILDFITQPESARMTINTWVADNTEQKILDLLEPGTVSSMTRLILTNAIYFKASWKDKFSVSNTGPATFTKLDGSASTVQMMRTILHMSGNSVAGEYGMAIVPYYESTADMVVIQPAPALFASFESSLTAESLASIISLASVKTLTLSMPRFDFGWDGSLKSTLQGLGMQIPFTSQADFSGITTQQALFIGDVVHKATITVNEEGTEAAAATAVVMPPSLPPAMALNLNTPFLFFIRHRATGAILFAGRVMAP